MMKSQTAMEAAFETAGYSTIHVRLQAVADKIIERGHGAEALAHSVLKDKDLLRALCEFYLAARRSNELRGTDHVTSDALAGRVPPAQLTPLSGKGHHVLDTQPLTAQPRQPHEGEGGHSETEALAQSASPPSPVDSGEGHRAFDHRDHRAPSAVILTPEKRAAYAKAANVIAITILDTDRLSNGQVIGNLYWGSLSRLRANSAYDAALLQLIMNHGVANPHAKVRDVITVETYQKFKQRAAEISNAA